MDFPKFDLTFDLAGDHPILKDAAFQLNESSALNHRLMDIPPKGKYFHAMCILMALAKYRGESFADRNKVIEIRDRKDGPTWIKTLSVFFGNRAQYKFFSDYFADCVFISAGRGSRHIAKNKQSREGIWPSANFLCGRLPLRNLHFLKTVKGRKEGEPIEGEALAELAEQLERPQREDANGWNPIVPEIILETERDRPKVSETGFKFDGFDQATEQKPFLVTTLWRIMNEKARNAVKNRSLAGDWYVVSVVPNWLPDWQPILSEAVARHDARIKIIYQAPSAANHCPAVKAQLRINSDKVDAENADEVIKYIQGRVNKFKITMADWVRETGKSPVQSNPAKGSFEFFESYINHPFMAIMMVPPASSKKSAVGSGAPSGTWCLVGVYPFYRKHYGKCCSVYLTGDNSVLDFYYHTILDLFERGSNKRDGYLKLVDLLKKQPRRKRK